MDRLRQGATWGATRRGTRRRAWVIVASLVLAGAATLENASPAGAQASDDGVVELAERHAPVVWIREQDEPCDTEGEPFEPTAVDIVLDNPEVFLRQVGNDDPVAVRGPSATDIFDLREGWYLDFPGDALEPGCIFEQDFRRFAGDRSSVVYAHVATELGRPGLLALQYWFFWYHNPAKNDHEGDWEFVQLLFEADSAADALGRDPVAVGYAQHTGGERADWNDDKLDREGERPVVYPAVGSHASYFGQALYLGRSGSEGFGCDNTDGPSRRLDPEVVVLPDGVSDADDPLAWLAFQGRWGQRERGFFNGPTGPFAKERWTEPVTWHEGLRDSSVVIPGGDEYGDDVLVGFCNAVEVGSTLLVGMLRSPVTAMVVLAVIVGAGIALALATRWGPSDPGRLRRHRAFGQIMRAAWRRVRDQPALFLAIGLVAVPVSLLTSLAQWMVLSIPLVGDVVDLAGQRSAVSLLLAVVVGGLGSVFTFAIISSGVALVVDDRAPRRLADRGELRRTLARLVGALARAIGIVIVLFISVVGIPWGIRQLVRYQVLPQVVALEGRGGADALARCAGVVAGRWWWTFAVVAVLQAVMALVAVTLPLVALVTVTSLPLWAYGLLGSVVHLVMGPVVAATMTYVYGTLVADLSGEPRGAEKVRAGSRDG